VFERFRISCRFGRCRQVLVAPLTAPPGGVNTISQRAKAPQKATAKKGKAGGIKPICIEDRNKSHLQTPENPQNPACRFSTTRFELVLHPGFSEDTLLRA
jgi:hypothetical protein